MKIKKINIFGCPNAGKSVLAAMCYAQLAMKGYSVELVREVHKDYIAHTGVLPKHMVASLYDKQRDRETTASYVADTIVTDCPLPLCGFYAERAGVDLDVDFGETNSLNILINPDFERPYDNRGRVHGKDDMRSVQSDLIDYLIGHNVEFSKVEPDEADTIGNFVERLMENN